MTKTKQAAERAARPGCDRAITSAGNPARPFRSIGRTLIDLGSWLDGTFRVPGPPLASPDSPVSFGPGRDA